MKKSVLFIAIIAMATITISGCSINKSSSSSKEPIKIGVITSLSGDLSVYGEGMKNSVLLAIDNSGLKDKIQVIIEDDHSCNITDDVSVTQKLLNIDKVDAIVGPMCSSAALSTIPLTEPLDKILISPMASSQSLTSSDFKFFFRTIASDAEKSITVSNYAYNKGFRNAALIYDIANDSFIQERNDLEKSFTGLGGKIIGQESFKTGDKDFRTQLTKIKSFNADVIFVGGFPKEVGAMLKQARELGINLQFISTESSVGVPDLLEVGGIATENLIYPFADTPSSTQYVKFQEEYKNKFNADPPTYGAPESYDAAVLLIKAIEQSDRSGEGIKKELYSLGQNYHGASGIINFMENGDVSKPMSIKTVKNGQFVNAE
ncbi:MAG: ABC transporter substrate-binding protein [Candidatus Buchananbacteria bacterium]